ncbi:WG repeat-containing protein [Crocinitomix catalasitica]|nr:WG repeat-containing protein [Crocinitomix catalasitica]
MRSVLIILFFFFGGFYSISQEDKIIHMFENCYDQTVAYYNSKFELIGTSDYPSEPFEGVVQIKNDDGTFSVIKANGDYLLKGKFRSISDFHDGIATAKPINGYPFFFTSDGKTFKSDARRARYFVSGFCQVGDKNKKWGFIDKTGKLVVPCAYDQVYNFEGGYARVKNGNKQGVTDSTGKLVIPVKYGGVSYPAGGFILVRESTNDRKSALFDLKGERLTDFIYEGDDLRAKGEMICVSGFVNGKSQELIMNKKLEFIYAFNRCPAWADEPTDDIVCGKRKDGRWVCINPSGEELFVTDFTQIHGIFENRIIARINDDYGVLNLKGEWLIPAEYDYIQFDDEEELFHCTNLQNKTAVIDRQGKIIMQPKYYSVGPLRDGLRRCGIGWSRGYTTGIVYVNEKWEEVFKPKTKLAGDFKNGVAFIGEPSADATSDQLKSCAYINTKGEIIWNPEFKIDESYLIFPPNRDAKKKYPLLILLPYTYGSAFGYFTTYVGSFKGISLGSKQLGKFLSEVWPNSAERKKYEFAVMITGGTGGPRDHDSDGFVKAIKRYDGNIRAGLKANASSIDTTKLYLSGYSLGGDLSWALTMKNGGKYKGCILAGTRCSYSMGTAYKELIKVGAKFYMGAGDREEEVRIKGMDRAKTKLDTYKIPVQRYVIPGGGHVMIPKEQFIEALRFVME